MKSCFIAPIVMVLAVCSAATSTLAQSPSPAADTHALPADLQQSIDVARKYDLARTQAILSTWEKTETLSTTDPADKAKWRANGGEITTKADGLKLAGKADTRSVATYAAKKWTLPVGVSYEVMIPDGPAWDGGMKLVPANQAPESETVNGIAFVVGGFRDTENYLEYLGQNHHDLGGPLLKTGKWTKVTLLVSTTSLVAMLDDQPIANEALQRRVAQQLELSVYTFSDAAIYRNVSILKPKAKEANATMPALEVGEEQNKAIEIAAKYLGDDSFERRQAASDTLYMLRPACNEVLKKLKESTDMEVVTRATQIAQKIAAEGKSPGATVRTPRGAGVMPMIQQQGAVEVQIQPMAR